MVSVWKDQGDLKFSVDYVDIEFLRFWNKALSNQSIGIQFGREYKRKSKFTN